MSAHAAHGREIEPRVPAVQAALLEGEGEDDAGVEELVLVARTRGAPPPDVHVEAESRAHALLHADHVVALPLHCPMASCSNVFVTSRWVRPRSAVTRTRSFRLGEA